MVSSTVARNLGLAILQRAEKNAVAWRAEGGRYVVDLDDFNVRISPASGADPQPDIMFEVLTPHGAQLATLQVKQGEEDYPNFLRLWRCAETYDSQWDRVVQAAIENLKGAANGGEKKVVVEFPLQIDAAPLPLRPTAEQARRFFAKIHGRWRLDFEKPNGERGIEIAEIDESGNYFSLTDRQGRPQAKASAPRFRLLLWQADEKLEHVEISKQELNGRHRQLELLQLLPPEAPTEMRGVARHDEHRLVYAKLA